MYSLRSGRKEKGDLMTDVCRGIFGWGGGFRNRWGIYECSALLINFHIPCPRPLPASLHFISRANCPTYREQCNSRAPSLNDFQYRTVLIKSYEPFDLILLLGRPSTQVVAKLCIVQGSWLKLKKDDKTWQTNRKQNLTSAYISPPLSTMPSLLLCY